MRSTCSQAPGRSVFEALSRGAPDATFIEKHVPTARIVEENIRTLGVEDRSKLITTSAFLWAKRDLPHTSVDKPWLVFCSPPYAFYHERQAEMLDLISRIMQSAPRDSILVVEADEPFDFDIIRDAADSEKRTGRVGRPRLSTGGHRYLAGAVVVLCDNSTQ